MFIFWEDPISHRSFWHKRVSISSIFKLGMWLYTYSYCPGRRVQIRPLPFIDGDKKRELIKSGNTKMNRCGYDRQWICIPHWRKLIVWSSSTIICGHTWKLSQSGFINGPSSLSKWDESWTSPRSISDWWKSSFTLLIGEKYQSFFDIFFQFLKQISSVFASL